MSFVNASARASDLISWHSGFRQPAGGSARSSPREHDDGEAHIGAILRRDALNERALLALGAGHARRLPWRQAQRVYLTIVGGNPRGLSRARAIILPLVPSRWGLVRALILAVNLFLVLAAARAILAHYGAV